MILLMDYNIFLEKWKKYQQSSSWKRLKISRLLVAKGQCEGDDLLFNCRCSCKENLELHHLEYPDFPFEKYDDIENVRILCRDCHQLYFDGVESSF